MLLRSRLRKFVNLIWYVLCYVGEEEGGAGSGESLGEVDQGGEGDGKEEIKNEGRITEKIASSSPTHS